MNGDQRKLYADAVWTAFCLKAGKPEWHISANEWDQLRDWMDRGIPLRYVLQGMENCKKGGKSLRYVVPAVEDEIKHARMALVF